MMTIEQTTLQKVLIVGAPNVGKSTLFNALIGQRKAIVFKEPGVTRDMIYGAFEEGATRFTLIDTGGLIPRKRDRISEAVLKQVLKAVAQAALTIFVVDGRTGVTPLDEEISLFLLRSGAKVVLCVNKIDLPDMEELSIPFYSLGFGEPISVSAENRREIDVLIERIKSKIDTAVVEQSHVFNEQEGIRVVIAGRQNVGKSSLLNALIGDERMIVSEVPGTTIDSVDSLIEHRGKRYIIVDTAGMRKKKRAQGDVEKIAVIKARQHIKACDIVILVIDSCYGISSQDAAIAGYAAYHCKPVLVLFNKWDLIDNKAEASRYYASSLDQSLRAIKDVSSLHVSALTGKGVDKIFAQIDGLFERYTRKISTSELNRFMSKTAKKHPIFSSLSSKEKLFYIVQAGVRPQKFIVFAKSAKKIATHKRRFLENMLREGFDLKGIPIHIEFRERRESLKRVFK